MDQRMKYSYAAVCATGRVRTENQDRIYLNGTICGGGYAQTDGTGRKQGLFAVADGMGGQAQGAQAAQAARNVQGIAGAARDLGQAVTGPDGQTALEALIGGLGGL